jgi:hypothetical protein
MSDIAETGLGVGKPQLLRGRLDPACPAHLVPLLIGRKEDAARTSQVVDVNSTMTENKDLVSSTASHVEPASEEIKAATEKRLESTTPFLYPRTRLTSTHGSPRSRSLQSDTPLLQLGDRGSRLTRDISLPTGDSEGMDCEVAVQVQMQLYKLPHGYLKERGLHPCAEYMHELFSQWSSEG